VSGHDQSGESSSHAALAQTERAAPAEMTPDDAANLGSMNVRDKSKAPEGIVTKLVSAAEAALSKLTTSGSPQASEERTTPQSV